jgi:hypothetical protein
VLSRQGIVPADMHGKESETARGKKPRKFREKNKYPVVLTTGTGAQSAPGTHPVLPAERRGGLLNIPGLLNIHSFFVTLFVRKAFFW